MTSLDRRRPHWNHTNHDLQLQDMNTSPLEQLPDVQTARAELLDEREKQGMCLTCGQRLFDVKQQESSTPHKQRLLKFFRKNASAESSSPTASPSSCNSSKQSASRTPLTILGKVERGQCLTCCPSSTIGAPNNNPNSASLVASSDSNNNNSKAVYTGDYNIYGERDGHGELQWDNGDVYTGSFFNGKLHGHGQLSFAQDAGEYIGEWECGVQHGIGTRRYANGDCYAGSYINGKRTGDGRFYFANGDMYTGEWDNGIMQGSGRYYYNSGQRFEGTFRQGKRTGKGKLQRRNGSIDIGLYVNDVRTGLGVRWNTDRTVAWKMLNGIVQHKISIPEAVALDYDIEAAATALERIA